MIKPLGADALPGPTQRPRRGLPAAALAGQAPRRRLERLVVFTPLVGRRPADFGCHNSRNRRPASVRHRWTTSHCKTLQSVGSSPPADGALTPAGGVPDTPRNSGPAPVRGRAEAGGEKNRVNPGYGGAKERRHGGNELTGKQITTTVETGSKEQRPGGAGRRRRPGPAGNRSCSGEGGRRPQPVAGRTETGGQRGPWPAGNPVPWARWHPRRGLAQGRPFAKPGHPAAVVRSPPCIQGADQGTPLGPPPLFSASPAVPRGGERGRDSRPKPGANNRGAAGEQGACLRSGLGWGESAAKRANSPCPATGTSGAQSPPRAGHEESRKPVSERPGGSLPGGHRAGGLLLHHARDELSVAVADDEPVRAAEEAARFQPVGRACGRVGAYITRSARSPPPVTW